MEVFWFFFLQTLWLKKKRKEKKRMKLSVKLFVQAGQIHFQLPLTPSSLHKTRREKKKRNGGGLTVTIGHTDLIQP